MQSNDNNQQGMQRVQGALSLSNSVLIIGGTLFTIAAFFVSLGYRVSNVESQLKDFPLYRVENRLTSIEQSIQQLRDDVKSSKESRRSSNGDKNNG